MMDYFVQAAVLQGFTKNLTAAGLPAKLKPLGVAIEKFPGHALPGCF